MDGDAHAGRAEELRQSEGEKPSEPGRKISRGRKLLLVLIALTCGSSPRPGQPPRAFEAHGTRRMRSGSLVG